MNTKLEAKLSHVPQYSLKIRGEWARIVLEPWEGGGSLIINSSYGAYGYIWTSIGADTFKQFLLSLDKSYFLGKLGQGLEREFDFDKTVKGIYENLLKLRRDGRGNKEKTREFWDEFTNLVDEGFNNTESFCREVMYLSNFDYIYNGDYPETYTNVNRDLNNFYESIWVQFKEVLQKELECQESSTV